MSSHGAYTKQKLSDVTRKLNDTNVFQENSNQIKEFLAFRELCIVIYSYITTNEMH
jgi:hypothetical protein